MKSLLTWTERRLPRLFRKLSNRQNFHLKAEMFSFHSKYFVYRGRLKNWVFVSSVRILVDTAVFPSLENIEISLYAQARKALLLLTQGNIYNRLRFLNKYLMFLEELNELFRENWSKFLTAGYLVFWKQFPAAGYLDRNNITFPIDGA